MPYQFFACDLTVRHEVSSPLLPPPSGFSSESITAFGRLPRQRFSIVPPERAKHIMTAMDIFSSYTLIHPCGIKSLVSNSFLLNHFFGAMTILFGFPQSHAPHQEKLLLAMMWRLQRLMSLISSQAMSGPFWSMKSAGCANLRFSFAHWMSSEKTKKWGSFTFFAIFSIAAP